MMETDIIVPVAASLGSAVAAGLGGFRIAQSRMAGAPGQGPALGQGGAGVVGRPPIFVRLSAEDSDRIERIDSLLARLVSLEEQTQAAVTRLSDLVVQARLEQATLAGMVRGREGR